MKNIPKLRFPEFQNAPEWEEKKLIDIANFINEKIALNKLTLNNYISTENLLQDFSGVSVSSKLPDVKTVTHFKINDILISNIRPYLKKVWSATFDGGASNDVIVARAKESTNNNFLTYILKNEEFINYVMQGAKGVKMPRGDIALIKKYPLYISTKPKEQQKIADCLSSLDELILAQSEKAEALKTHKKALMQQLFPSVAELVEAKNIPRLRFPEFKDAPEWEEQKIDDIGKIITGNTPSTSQSEYYGGNKLFVSPADISDNRYITTTKTTLTECGFLETRQIEANSILFVCIGSTIGKIAQNKYICATNQQINSIIPSKEYCNDFIYSLLENNYSKITLLVGNHAVPIINKTIFSSIKVLIPLLEEQQKIADCLSSLDELILAQSEKVEALKTHKKALMQQLFPNQNKDDTMLLHTKQEAKASLPKNEQV
ncbi:MAG: hypothetical protein RL154_810 [Pseudomonadota bacterium]|jgi:type I restriction enzyme S subunit